MTNLQSSNCNLQSPATRGGRARRLNGRSPVPRPSSPAPHGFTLVELLVVITIIGILIALLPPATTAMMSSAAGADFCVAPDGKDTNPGTATEPFATVAAARNAVRKEVAAGLNHNVVVLIRGGAYPQTKTLVFGPEDSGNQKHSITYAAVPGEKVTLSGGRTITGWKRGAGPIWTVDLPEVKAGKWYFRQLFVGGRRAIRARTPNLGETWWKLQPRPNNSDANDATITLGVDHPIREWNNVSDVEVIWLNNNDGTRKRLGSVKEADNTFTLPPPHAWPHSFPGEYNIGFPGAALACYFENALEMLDQPGEWYLDRRTGSLSYWPREGEDLTRAEVVAPVVENTLLVVRGTPDRPVQNLHFQGIRVAYVEWPLPPCGFTGLFGCLQIEERKNPPGFRRFYWIDPAVSFKYARGCNFIGGATEHAGAIGLGLLNGCTQNVIEGNEIHDLGGGGIVAGGIRNRDSWQWADPLEKEDHKGHRIANNHIHDCGSDYFGAVGIFIALTQEAVVAHNLIHDIAYCGIVLNGNEAPGPFFAKNNILEYNHIHHVMQGAVDGAGIYASFPQGGWGAILRGNLIHDTGHGGGIYFDTVRRAHACAGYRCQGNVVYRSVMPVIGPDKNPEDVPWIDNRISLGDGPPAELVEALRTRAGLEPAYRRALSAPTNRLANSTG